jgi:hypothetical protein
LDTFEVRVRLQHGDARGEWPVIERVFVVGPQHTLLELALAIESEFDREEQDHWHSFRLKDILVLGAWDSSDEMPSLLTNPITADVKVSEFVEPGTHFEYVFDMGASWTHDCFIPKRSLGKHPTPLKPLCISRDGQTVPQYEG